MKTRKILFVSHTVQIGGAEISLTLLLKHIDKANFHPLVALPAFGPLAERLSRLGVETAILPMNRLRWRNPWPYIKTVSELVRLIKKRRIDLVHTNIEFANQYGAVAARMARVPCVGHIRNILNRLNYWEYFLALPNVLIANSYATARSFKPYGRRSQQKVVIYNGLELDKFVPLDGGNRAFRNQLGIKENVFTIGVVARIVPAKGQHVFIKSLAEVVKTNPNVCALIVGDATIDDNQWFLDELRQQTAEIGLSDKVIFTGFVENMVNLYNSLDLVVLPSFVEPFGRVLIEAMAMKKPVVATKAGGAVEVVDNGVTGFLVPPGDSKHLAATILKLVENRELARRLGELGRRRVGQLFTIQQSAEKTQQVYRGVLGLFGRWRS